MTIREPVLKRTARKQHTCDAKGHYGCTRDITPGDTYGNRTIYPTATDGRPKRVKTCLPCTDWFEYSTTEDVLNPDVN